MIYWTGVDYEAASDAEPADPDSDSCSQKLEVLGRNSEIIMIFHMQFCVWFVWAIRDHETDEMNTSASVNVECIWAFRGEKDVKSNRLKFVAQVDFGSVGVCLQKSVGPYGDRTRDLGVISTTL